MSDATKTAEQVAYEIVTGLGLRADDPVGPDNDETIKRLASEATGICAGWGGSGPRSLRLRVAEVLAMIPGEVACIGKTRAGHPLHPSRPGYANELQIYAHALGASR